MPDQIPTVTAAAVSVTCREERDGSHRTTVEVSPSVSGAVSGVGAGFVVAGPPGAVVGGILGAIFGPKD